MAGESNRQLLNATAGLSFMLYGSTLYNTTYNLCSFNQTGLCPIQPNLTFSFTGWQPLPPQFIDQIPGFIFGLPDLGLQTQVTIQSPTTVNQSLCIVTSISNPEAPSFQNPVPRWLSIGLLIGAILQGVISFIYAFFDGPNLSNAVSSSTFPRVTDIVLFFQYVSYSGQMAFNYPDMYKSFTANFAWSMGLISIPFIDNAASTGTTQTSVNSTASYFVHIMKRADILPITSAPSNTSVTGIKAYVESINIPDTALFMTTLLVFVFVLAILTALMLLLWFMIGVLAVMACLQWQKVKMYAVQWPWLYFGYASRLALLALPPLLTYACYQYIHPVSTISTALSCLILVLYAILFCGTTFFILKAARQATLFSNSLNQFRYGYLYSSYKEAEYLFFIPVLLYTIAKALVLGLAQTNGEAQAIANVCIEALYFLVLIILRPYPVFKSNFFQGLMSFVRLLGFALLVACATVFAVDVATKSKLGLALVVLHSVTGALLYLLMILNILSTLLRKRNSRNQKLAPEEKKASEDSLNAPSRTEDEAV